MGHGWATGTATPAAPGGAQRPVTTHRVPSLLRAFLVPSFSFGENDLFRQVVFEEGSWMRSIQRRFQKMMGFAPCLFYGRGLTSCRSRGFLPYARPITTVGEHWGWGDRGRCRGSHLLGCVPSEPGVRPPG